MLEGDEILIRLIACLYISNVVQTGSGKTYTMGTSLKDGCENGLIPKVMNALFDKIETLNHEIEFQLHVSFIEVILSSLIVCSVTF